MSSRSTPAAAGGEGALSHPLLTKSGSSDALFQVVCPKSWTSLSSDTSCCQIEWDDSRELFKVIDKDYSVLDIISSKDIIGVNLSIDNTSKNIGDGNAASDNERTPSLLDQLIALLKDEHVLQPSLESSPISPSSSLVLNIFVYEKARKSKGWFCSNAPAQPNAYYEPETRTGHRFANHRHFPLKLSLAETDTDTVALDTLAQSLATWIHSIRRMAGLPTSTPPRLLVVINPSSGTGQAPKVWKQTVRPMLEEQANYHITTMTTEYAGHGYELMKTVPLESYQGLVSLGGDGILHELVNGLAEREDCEQIQKSLALGVLGCGTGNGLAMSLIHEAKELYSHLESTFLIARGQTISMDLSRYQTTNRTYTSFLTFTWAMIADLDIESEAVRWLGSLRFDLWAVYCVARMRRYRAKLSYLPKSSATAGPIDMPDLSDPVPSDWKVIEDDILLMWASHVSHASISTYSSPPSSMQDRVFQIMLVRGKGPEGRTPVGRLAMASILLGLDSGSHAQSKYVEFIECVAYRLEQADPEQSFNDLDGEIIERGPIQGCVQPAAMQVYGTVAIEE